jgi:hypothetical protein
MFSTRSMGIVAVIALVYLQLLFLIGNLLVLNGPNAISTYGYCLQNASFDFECSVIPDFLTTASTDAPPQFMAQRFLFFCCMTILTLSTVSKLLKLMLCADLCRNWSDNMSRGLDEVMTWMGWTDNSTDDNVAARVKDYNVSRKHPAFEGAEEDTVIIRRRAVWKTKATGAKGSLRIIVPPRFPFAEEMQYATEGKMGFSSDEAKLFENERKWANRAVSPSSFGVVYEDALEA